MTTSDLYLFNPTCDYAVGNGMPSWQPNKLLQKMEADMETLPLFFAKSEDYLLVENIPSDEYIDTLSKVNIDIPFFIEKKQALGDKTFINKPRNSLNPWGWSPVAHKFLSPFKDSCSDRFKNSPVFNWRPEYREVYSRKFALNVLHKLIKDFPDKHFISDYETAKICTKKQDFEDAIKDWGKIMVKAPWSSSGRGLQTVAKTPVHPKVWEKLMGIVNDQGYAMAEPLLNKKLDIAFQFKIEKQKIEFIGISNFITDAKGQYMGNNLNGLPDNIDGKLLDFARFIPEIIVEPLIRVFESVEITHFYEGFFGVDALIYEDLDGALKVNPCLEINFRYNMGLLSIMLEKNIIADRKGLFSTWFKPQKYFIDFKEEMEQQYPLKIIDGKIVSGFMALTDVQTDSCFGAYIL